MVSVNLKRRIENFIESLRTFYDPVEHVNLNSVDFLFNRYTRNIIEIDDRTKDRIIDILEESIIGNEDHGKIASWRVLCLGILKLLNNDSLEEVKDKKEAVDIVVRITRWAYSTGNFWKRFTPFAREIVSIVWGDIGNLYPQYCES